MIKTQNIRLLSIVFLAITTFILWLPTTGIPYWWDSAGYIIPAAHRFIDTGFNPLVPGFTDFAHPPLFIVLLAIVWMIFGESLFISHALNLIVTLLAVVYTFLLGTHMVKENGPYGAVVGTSAALLLLFTPVFMAQVGIIYIEIPVTAFALISTYYFLKRKLTLYSVAASLMVLTKEISVILCVIFLCAYLYSLKGKMPYLRNLKNHAREMMWMLLPFLLLAVWFVYHHGVTGWWFVVPGRRLVNTPGIFNVNVDYLIFTVRFIFLDQKRFLATAIVLILIILAQVSKRRKIKLKKLWSGERKIMPGIAVVLAVFFLKTEFLLRYSVLVLPFFYLTVSYNLFAFAKLMNMKRNQTVLTVTVITLALAGMFWSEWDTHRRINSLYVQPLEDNLEYRDVIELAKKSADYIRKTDRDVRVYTTFPFRTMLSDTGLHYVDKPFKTFECATYEIGDRVDMVLIHPYSPQLFACHELARVLKFQTIVPFEVNGKLVNIAKP